MKIIAVLIAIALTTGHAISQPYQTNDSSLIANKDLKKAAKIIEKAKDTEKELKLHQARVVLLENSNANKDSIISGHMAFIGLQDRLIVNLKAIDSGNRQIIMLKDVALNDLRSSAKAQKRRTLFATIVAVVSVALLVFK